jgi:hypothetical protein
MTERFHRIDRERFLAGEAFAGEGVALPPGVEANPSGLVHDVRIGRYSVRFFAIAFPGEEPRGGTIWNPEKPKKLKPRFLRQYRQARLEFTKEMVEVFGRPTFVIDRMDGAPRITARVFEDGSVERCDEPYVEEVRH